MCADSYGKAAPYLVALAKSPPKIEIEYERGHAFMASTKRGRGLRTLVVLKSRPKGRPYCSHAFPKCEEEKIMMRPALILVVFSVLLVGAKSTIQVSRNFHALFTKTFENSDACD